MGCAVACLAMVTRERYWKVARFFGNLELWDDGIAVSKIEDYLAEHGYAIRRLRWKTGRKWPPRPFADQHIALVQTDPDADIMHCVVWLRSGEVLDPADEKPAKLTGYFAVSDIVGVVKLD
jgi:hypothetical protein